MAGWDMTRVRRSMAVAAAPRADVCPLVIIGGQRSAWWRLNAGFHAARRTTRMLPTTEIVELFPFGGDFGFSQ